ncbi:MAG: TonB-dependent receptor [Prolixibacteraceae bacterium]|jgi:TonB-linked SusC/RagA family outer membrane protein|nr:TonB-dependent receptor [Prolixibacteraceae bacterium]
MKNRTVREVLQTIEEQSEFRFFYNEQFIDLNRKVSVNSENKNVESILKEVFDGANISFKVMENNLIIITPAEGMQNQQNKTISGRVTDSSGQPLPGVSVVLKSTTTGTITDFDGKYILANVPADAVLVFSFVGMKSQEIKMAGKSSINITMEEETVGIEEVVAIGYGIQKKVNLVGSVAAIKINDNISSRTLTNISTGLSGLIPGLSVQQSTGMAGKDGASLQIRGLGTVNNSSPLVVVDGMPDVDINRINMNDIESISVLKDAASSSIYGSRAANGVILITTKTGTRDKSILSYTGNFSLSQPTNFYNYFADYPRSLTMHKRAADNGQNSQVFKQGTIDEWLAKGMVDPFLYPNTNQWDLMIRTGKIQTHNLSATGGSEKMAFFISAGIINEKGVQIYNDFKRYNFRVNLDYKINPKINVGLRMDGQWSKMYYSLSDGFITPTMGDVQGAIAGILPIDPVTGKYGGAMAYGEDVFAQNNLSRYANIHNIQDKREFNGNLMGEWTPIEGLKVRIDYGLRYYDHFNKHYEDPTIEWNFQTGQMSRVLIGETAGVGNTNLNGYKTLLQGRITYERNLLNGHHISLLAGATEEYWNGRSLTASRTDRIHPSLTELDAALSTNQTNSGTSNAEGLLSYIGRFNYSIKDKYLFEANARYDGSSKFLTGSQFGFFPSLAVGWRFTEEQFFASIRKVVTSGKLRASYGKLGNNSGVGRYEQKDTYQLTNYILDGKLVKGFSANKIINPDFSWEETAVTNIGLDFVFLNGKITSEFDLYNRLTTDMIRPSQLSSLLSGYNAPRVNIGELQNRGIEANITWNSNIGEVNYGVNLNLSYNYNKLLKWNEFLAKGNTYLNLPYQFVYTSESYGIAQSWDDIQNAPYQNNRYVAPGDILYKDLNGDGQYTSEDRKAFPIFNQNSFPLQGGLNLYANWHGIDVNILFQGAALRKDYWLDLFNNTTIPAARRGFADFLWHDTWSLDNRSATLPRLLTGNGGNNNSGTDFWLDDFSYIRLKNIMVGYNFPKRTIELLGVEKLRIYFSSENLFTLTKFRGIDPEKSRTNNDPYPLLSTFSFGVNLDF